MFIFILYLSNNIIPLWFSIVISFLPITIILGTSSKASLGRSSFSTKISFPLLILLSINSLLLILLSQCTLWFYFKENHKNKKRTQFTLSSFYYLLFKYYLTIWLTSFSSAFSTTFGLTADISLPMSIMLSIPNFIAVLLQFVKFLFHLIAEEGNLARLYIRFILNN